tara:strand:+ start:133 stop:549 length:417 start_codon:yes stop_codon:yes gene_type:complete
MTKVICFGTFDLLHLGHLNYFQQAKQHGTHLTVVIATDETKEREGKPTIFSEQERLQLVKSIKLVDQAVLGYPDDHFKIIQEIQPDVLCLGYDHKINENNLRISLAQLNLRPEIKRMQPYKPSQIKSSLIKERILEQE